MPSSNRFDVLFPEGVNIMDYKILRAIQKTPKEALDTLEQRVNEALSDGWMPCGGVAFVLDGSLLRDNHPLCIACQSVSKHSPQ